MVEINFFISQESKIEKICFPSNIHSRNKFSEKKKSIVMTENLIFLNENKILLKKVPSYSLHNNELIFLIKVTH